MEATTPLPQQPEGGVLDDLDDALFPPPQPPSSSSNNHQQQQQPPASSSSTTPTGQQPATPNTATTPIAFDEASSSSSPPPLMTEEWTETANRLRFFGCWLMAAALVFSVVAIVLPLALFGGGCPSIEDDCPAFARIVLLLGVTSWVVGFSILMCCVGCGLWRGSKRARHPEWQHHLPSTAVLPGCYCYPCCSRPQSRSVFLLFCGVFSLVVLGLVLQLLVLGRKRELSVVLVVPAMAALTCCCGGYSLWGRPAPWDTATGAVHHHSRAAVAPVVFPPLQEEVANADISESLSYCDDDRRREQTTKARVDDDAV